jgi:hypothetical protein
MSSSIIIYVSVCTYVCIHVCCAIVDQFLQKSEEERGFFWQMLDDAGQKLLSHRKLRTWKLNQVSGIIVQSAKFPSSWNLLFCEEDKEDRRIQ